jgi:hypothetical protein
MLQTQRRLRDSRTPLCVAAQTGRAYPFAVSQLAPGLDCVLLATGVHAQDDTLSTVVVTGNRGAEQRTVISSYGTYSPFGFTGGYYYTRLTYAF